jgi:hypothetical protein
MMGLIHHQKIPPGLTRLSGALRVVGKKIEGANDKLAVEKGIGALELQRSAAVFVKNTEGHLEPAKHFYEPLVEQRGRQENQDAAGSACDVQAMQDKTGFDSFSKTHLVRKKDTGIHAGGDIGGDGNLVWNEVHASTRKAAHGALAHLTAAVETLHAQLEALKVIDLSGEETVFGFRKSDIVGKLRLGDIPRPAAIGEQTTVIGYGIYMKALAGVCADGVTLLEGDTANGCAAKCVLAVLACGGEKNLGAAELALQDDA